MALSPFSAGFEFENDEDQEGQQPPAESAAQPYGDVAADALLDEIKRLSQASQEKDNKLLSLMNDNARTQEILREQLARQVAPSTQASTSTEWYSVPNVAVGSTPAQQHYSAEEVRKIAAQAALEAVQAREAEAAKRQNEYNKRVAGLREVYTTKYAHIANDPVLNQRFTAKLNRYHGLSPNSSPEVLFEAAIQEMSEDIATFVGAPTDAPPPPPLRGKSVQPQAAPQRRPEGAAQPSTKTAGALQSYNMGAQGAAAPSQAQAQRGGYMADDTTPEETRRQSALERRKLYHETLKKTRS